MMSRKHFLRSSALVGLGAGAAFVTACTGSAQRGGNQASPNGAVPSAQSGQVLLVYFSRAGENYDRGGRIDLEIGNTRVVADMIAAATSADVYQIEAADPYPDDYEETVQRNVREQALDARPRIAGQLPDLAAYDTVLIGCPVWNVQAPMIMRTFIEGVDLSGKTVHPFVTHAVSGMGRVRTDYVRLLPGARVSDGLAVQGEEAAQARGEVEAWLRRIGLPVA